MHVLVTTFSCIYLSPEGSGITLVLFYSVILDQGHIAQFCESVNRPWFL